ncbi:MAG: hypothetical protein ABJB12_20080, partial [Pseudomonadota bacterium]
MLVAGCTGMVSGQPPLPDDSHQEQVASVASLDPSLPGPTPAMPLPADYKTWSPFLMNVQRPDSSQVRDIYINAIGATAEQGAP